jgi:hypothetical protein
MIFLQIIFFGKRSLRQFVFGVIRTTILPSTGSAVQEYLSPSVQQTSKRPVCDDEQPFA